MPANNETIIAIPLGVTNPQELRTFLIKLVVALDVLVGLRGGETPLVTKEFLEEELAKLVVPTVTIDKLPAYEQTVSATYVEAEVQAISDAVTLLTDKVNEIVGE